MISLQYLQDDCDDAENGEPRISKETWNCENLELHSDTSYLLYSVEVVPCTATSNTELNTLPGFKTARFSRKTMRDMTEPGSAHTCQQYSFPRLDVRLLVELLGETSRVPGHQKEQPDFSDTFCATMFKFDT